MPMSPAWLRSGAFEAKLALEKAVPWVSERLGIGLPLSDGKEGFIPSVLDVLIVFVRVGALEVYGGSVVTVLNVSERVTPE